MLTFSLWDVGDSTSEGSSLTSQEEDQCHINLNTLLKSYDLEEAFCIKLFI